MYVEGDEQDFIAAGNDCRAVTNLSSLCPPPGRTCCSLSVFDGNTSETGMGRSLTERAGVQHGNDQGLRAGNRQTVFFFFLCHMGERY